MWQRVYRALNHGDARKACKNVPPSFPEEVRQFGQKFAELQSKRHQADYDPNRPFRKSNVIEDIESARKAIERFLGTPLSVRRGLRHPCADQGKSRSLNPSTWPCP